MVGSYQILLLRSAIIQDHRRRRRPHRKYKNEWFKFDLGYSVSSGISPRKGQ